MFFMVTNTKHPFTLFVSLAGDRKKRNLIRPSRAPMGLKTPLRAFMGLIRP
jgi:hypothetical protein